MTPKTILIVDDEEVVRRLISVALQWSEDTEVIEAIDATEALEISKHYRGRIDLLLSDIVMPGEMNGAELATRITALRPETRVLLMSGRGLEDVKLNPEWHFIQKPFGVTEIRELIRRILTQGFEHQLRRAG